MTVLRTLPDTLERSAGADAGYCFVSGDGERRCSYAELRQAALRTGGSLRAGGLNRGDLVGLVLPDAEQFLTTLFGASIASLVPASIYPPSTTSDLPRYFEQTAAILRASGARALVTSRALAPAFEEVRRLSPELYRFSASSFDSPALGRTGALVDDIAFVQFTSGSVVAKGVALTRKRVGDIRRSSTVSRRHRPRTSVSAGCR
jgi:fatty-acyl-CoA synthase